MEHAETKHLERVAWFDFSSEGQHCCMVGINLLATVVSYWNTVHLDGAFRQRKRAGLTVDPEILPTSRPSGGLTACSQENTGGRSASSGLSVRFCPCRSRPVSAWPTEPAADAGRVLDWYIPQLSVTEGRP